MTSTAVVSSRKHLPLQMRAVERTLQLVTRFAECIKHLVNEKEESPLLDLLSELCSVTRVLVHLKEAIQNEALVDQGAITLTTLGGPPGSLRQFWSILQLLIWTFNPGRARREWEWKQAAETFNVISIKRRCEKQKIDLLSTLPNNHPTLSQAMEDTSIPNLDEQGGESTSARPGEVYSRERVIQWLLGNRVALDDPETVTLPVLGTGRWLLESKEFEAWKTKPQSVIWLYGIPGSGKTTLCGSVIEHMKFNDTSSDPLAYFFFGPQQGVAANYTKCLRSLVTQLDNSDRRPRVADLTLHSCCPFSDHAAYQSMLLESLQDLLLKRRTFIILDGIDEAQDKEKVMELLSIFANTERGHLHLLISSRPGNKMIKALDPMLVASMDVGGSALNKDISVYIEHYFHISSTTKTWQESSKCRTRDWLVSEAAGRFDWITFCLVLLERFPEFETDIQRLPKSMPGIFNRLLSSISEENEKEAHRALQWLAFAERPLYLDELAQAAVIDSTADGVLSTPLPTSYAIDDICLGLTISIPTIEDGMYRKKIVFAHHSLRDHLLSGASEFPRAAMFRIKETEAQLMISCTSLNIYLSSTLDDPTSAEELNSPPLLDYVVKYWYKHLEAVTAYEKMPEDIDNLAAQLLDEAYKRKDWNDQRVAFMYGPGETTATDAIFELKGPRIATLLLGPRGQDPTPLLFGPEGQGKIWMNDFWFPSPLYYASCHGWIEMVRILISRGEHDRGTLWFSGFFGTALQAASYRGHYDVSEMLIKAGAAVNPAPGFYGNPVHAAACNGHAKLIELLIVSGADFNAKGGVYGNALVAAAKGGHQTAVNRLTESGVELNAEGSEEYPTALYAASLNGHREVVARLLLWGADPNKVSVHGKSALQAAVKGGYEDIVALLMQYDASLAQKCQNGLNVGELTLHMAVKGGHMDLVRSLLTYSYIDANLPNEEGLSPLLIAASQGHTEMVRLLLEKYRKDINTTARDTSDSTALMIAVKNGYLDIARAILEHGARTGVTHIHHQGSRSLMMAVSGGNQGLVLLLLEYGVEAWEPVGSREPYANGQRKTPLITAIEIGQEAIAFLLLQHGAKIDDADGSGKKPMDMAISKGNRAIEKMLKFGEGRKAIAERDRWWKTVSRLRDDWEKIN